MKTLRPLLLTLALSLFSGGLHAAAPTFDSATVTFIQHDVAVAELEVLQVDAAGKVARRPASLNEALAESQALLTGRKSRAELKLNDGTIARVGQLSSFTYGKGTRLLQVKQGSALFVVPKGHGGTTIQAGAVTAAITGTTLLVQVFGDRVLIYVYEGSVEVAGQTVGAGQVITIPNGGAASLAAFDVRRGVETAALFSRFIDSPSQDEVLRQLGTALTGTGVGVTTPPTDLGDDTVVNPRVNTPPPPPREGPIQSPGDFYNPPPGQNL
jgi:hypothetical protein